MQSFIERMVRKNERPDVVHREIHRTEGGRAMTEAITFIVGIGTGVIISSLAMLVALATDWMRREE